MTKEEHEYIEIIFREQPKKTKIFEVVAKSNGIGLAVIKWYGAWRQYCLFPYNGTIFNHACLEFIRQFLLKENEIQKATRRTP